MSSRNLKITASIFMLLDHIALFLINPILPIYWLFRILGRISFPIFAFLIVEGLKYTKNFTNYLKRLLLLGFVLEILLLILFFTFGYNYTYFKFLGNHITSINILPTLLNGLIAIYFLKKNNLIGKFIYLLNFIFSFFLPYGFFGFLLITSFYLIKNKILLSLIVFMLNIIYFIYPYILFDEVNLFRFIQIFSMASLPILFAYKPKKENRFKHLFYYFYPAHIIVLYILMILFK